MRTAPYIHLINTVRDAYAYSSWLLYSLCDIGVTRRQMRAAKYSVAKMHRMPYLKMSVIFRKKAL